MSFLFKFFICGLFVSLLFPPFFITPLGFILYPYIFYQLIHKKFIKKSFFIHFCSGFFFGIGIFLILLIWIKEPFFVNVNTQKYSFLSYLLILYCSLFFGISFLILKFFNDIYAKLILFPVILVLSEITCANLSFGFPWYSHSLIFSSNKFGLTSIYFLGNTGLSYVTLLLFTSPVILFFPKFYNYKFKYYFYLICIIFLFSLLLLLIILRLFSNENIYSKKLNVSLVQLNLPINQSLNSAELLAKKNIILNEIRNNKENIIIFGENNLPYLVENEIEYKEISELININESVIVGLTRKNNGKYHNSLALIEKNNVKIFDKKILVPFGEFVPLRKYLSFMDIIAGTEDFTEGTIERKIITKHNINIIPVICYEIIFFWKLINKNNYNSDLIVNITNDSWFGDLSGPYQHFYLSRLRSAELNKPLIRVSNNGISAYIDNFGNIISFTELNKKEIQKITISLLKDHKNFLNYHKAILYFLSFLIFIALILNYKNESRKI